MLGMFVELSERYCVEFDTAGLNLYRDGSDSVRRRNHLGGRALPARGPFSSLTMRM